MMRFILSTLFFLLTIFFAYKSYTQYQNYKIVQKSDKTIVWISNLTKALDSIENERVQSAIYLGYKGKIDFNILKNLREKTDSSIKNITQFIDNNPQFLYAGSLQKIHESLQYVRSRVDVISLDYDNILFSSYQDEILEIFLDHLKNSIYELSHGFSYLKEYLTSYLSFIRYQNNIEKERSFIVYFLSLSKKMSTEDLLIWDNILDEDIYPAPQKLLNLKNTQISQNFSELIFEKRAKVAKGVIDGHYLVGITDWLGSLDEKINSVKLSQKILYDYFKVQIENKPISKKWILIYSIASVVSFIFFILALLLKSESKESKTQDVKNWAKEDVLETTHVIHNDMIEINNSVKKQQQIFNKTNGNEIELFNIFEIFAPMLEPYKQKAYSKSINFNYYVDPSIPSFCMGNISKIKEILTLIIDHTIKETSSKGIINVNIEKTAESKTQSAIEFIIMDSEGYIGRRLKSTIIKAPYYSEEDRITKFGNIESDMIYASRAIYKMGGTYEIKTKSKHGSSFSFTLSLKKAIT